ncbi:MAG: DUF2520 domain-containing protein [Bacteroidales bacterium]|nr:DUF2520 domain-containing protein [Bacteroidales bacterium]
MKIVIVGAGRVGSALSKAFIKSGHSVLKIISRSGEKAERLANEIGCGYGNKLIIPEESEMVILAVNDDALYGVLKEINIPASAIIAHTAGSVSLDIFGSETVNQGVFYPLQTFTLGRKYDFSTIPLFIEGNNDYSVDILKSLADSISQSVFYLSSEKRKYLHLAAVFACNFVNHMYYAGKEISDQAGMDFNVLIPLLRETMEKASDLGPERSQTGPAVRNDKKTIEKHLDLLSFSSDLQKIYQVITDSIINKYTG